MKWSAAIRAVPKPRFFALDEAGNILSWLNRPESIEVTEDVDVDRRITPGDFVDVIPDLNWTCDEAQHREIVQMIKDAKYIEAHKDEMEALYNGPDFQRIYEDMLRTWIKDYRLFPAEIRQYFTGLPRASFWHLKGEDAWTPEARKRNLIIHFDGPEAEQIPGLLEPLWEEGKKKHLKKRRMSIPEEVLDGAGIDLDKMKDPRKLYDPRPKFVMEDGYDKLKKRKLKKTDGLNLMVTT